MNPSPRWKRRHQSVSRGISGSFQAISSKYAPSVKATRALCVTPLVCSPPGVTVNPALFVVIDRVGQIPYHDDDVIDTGRQVGFSLRSRWFGRGPPGRRSGASPRQRTPSCDGDGRCASDHRRRYQSSPDRQWADMPAQRLAVSAQTASTRMQEDARFGASPEVS